MDSKNAGLTSNPSRDMVVYAVTKQIAGYTIYEVESELSSVEITTAFEENTSQIQQEIAEVGNLIFSY